MKATKEKAWANDDLLADIVSICGSDTENEGEKYIFEDDTASEFGGSETGDMYSPADMYSPDGKRHEGYVPQELGMCLRTGPYVMLGRSNMLWVGHSRSRQKS